MPAVATVFRFLTGLLLAGLVISARGAGLPPAFKAALKEAGIPLDHVAVVVQPLDSRTPVLHHNANAALNAASVMKLVTSFAALNQLGPAYTWTTDVWAEGPIVDGVLNGDLVIKGYGDPSLTLERMWLLQRELRARGVRHIRGNLILDASYFDLPPSDPGAFDDEPFAAYNAVPGALEANFNAITLHLRPNGDRVTVAPDIALPVPLVSHLELTDAAECNDWKDALAAAVPDSAHPQVVVTGTYARGCGERAWPLSLYAPEATFDLIFRSLWAESGGTLSGATLAGRAPDSVPLLRFTSEPLAAALTRLNKYSNNLMARTLFLTLGAERYGAPATPEKGAEAVREQLAARGVTVTKLVLENGAGLSRVERVSAETLTQILRAAYHSPFFAEFESALPIVAIDGTLKRRFKDSPLRGHAHLKTGTLRDASALAGYVFDARGREVSFVMLVNHANARRSEAAQRALLEWVQAGAARARARKGKGR